MSVYKSINTMICRYGEDVTVRDKESTRHSKAIIQPLLYKNKMYLGGVNLPAGYYDEGHYLMIAPAQEAVYDYRSALIFARNVTYTIKRAEVVRADNTDLYIWAVLTPYNPPAEDDYDDLDKCA